MPTTHLAKEPAVMTVAATGVVTFIITAIYIHNTLNQQYRMQRIFNERKQNRHYP